MVDHNSVVLFRSLNNQSLWNLYDFVYRIDIPRVCYERNFNELDMVIMPSSHLNRQVR